jgi:hypothetical protein
MTTLRERAEKAELAIQQALGTTGESDKIVLAIEDVAREFAETAVRKALDDVGEEPLDCWCAAHVNDVVKAAIASAERGKP